MCCPSTLHDGCVFTTGHSYLGEGRPGHALRKLGAIRCTLTPSVVALGLLLCACRYRIHCLGHSLGGGVAALSAYLLRTRPDLREQLQAASGVMATGNDCMPLAATDC